MWCSLWTSPSEHSPATAQWTQPPATASRVTDQLLVTAERAKGGLAAACGCFRQHPSNVAIKRAH
jgi:hypothetical protein